jgi:predicted MFS family arabinose efflux permease
MRRPFLLAGAGLLALAVAMGVGRFAFTPLLPLMQADADVTLTEGSWLAFANYLGYLVGALATVWMRVAPHRMVRAGLIATGILTLAVGLAHGFAAWWALRFLGGVASAWVLVFAASLVLERLVVAGAPQLFGLVFGGVGVGIVATGLACLALSGAGVGSGGIWVAFGLASLAATALCWNTFTPMSTAGAPAAEPAVPRSRRAWGRAAWTLIVAYGVYGFGYIIPGTFLPVIARDLLGGAFAAGWFWPMFGAAAFAGTLLLGRLPDASLRTALVACYFTEALGVIIPVLSGNAAGLAAGSLLLGFAFVAITTLTLRQARVLAAATRTDVAPLMGALTASFGVGQLVGPPFAGYLVVWLGGFGPSLVVAALGLAAGGIALWIMGR